MFRGRAKRVPHFQTFCYTIETISRLSFFIYIKSRITRYENSHLLLLLFPIYFFCTRCLLSLSMATVYRPTFQYNKTSKIYWKPWREAETTWPKSGEFGFFEGKRRTDLVDPLAADLYRLHGHIGLRETLPVLDPPSFRVSIGWMFPVTTEKRSTRRQCHVWLWKVDNQ